MGITTDGNSLVITGATITINNAFDQTTGAATITITPSGGVGTLPALLEGQPGLPPVIRNSTTHQVPSGTALPTPSSLWTLISPGGPGVASVYDFDIWVNSGGPGDSGSFQIQSATDLSGTANNNWTLIWNALTDQFEYQPLYLGATYWPTTINSTSGYTAPGTPRILTQISVPALPFAYYPVPTGQSVISGSNNTQVTLSANVGSVSGDQVGVGYGVAGLPQQTIALGASIPAGSTGSYGQVAANSAATIVFSATETAATTDTWATSPSTTYFNMTINPVPPS